MNIIYIGLYQNDCENNQAYIYIYIYIYVCMYIYIYIYIYMYVFACLEVTVTPQRIDIKFL